MYNFGMKNSQARMFVVIALVVILSAVGALMYAATKPPKADAPTVKRVKTETITVTGTYECLPPKNTGGPVTLECALGIKTDDKYYGLGGPSSYDSLAPTGSKVRVTGTLDTAPTSSGKYDTAGTITVTKFEKM